MGKTVFVREGDKVEEIHVNALRIPDLGVISLMLPDDRAGQTLRAVHRDLATVLKALRADRELPLTVFLPEGSGLQQAMPFEESGLLGQTLAAGRAMLEAYYRQHHWVCRAGLSGWVWLRQ